MMTKEDILNYVLVGNKIRERTTKLIEEFLELDSNNYVEVTDINVFDENIFFNYHILDERGKLCSTRHLVYTTINNFCSECCSFTQGY